jgi:hypothetical protein
MKKTIEIQKDVYENAIALICELRDELREYGKEEDDLFQIFSYYERLDLLDFGKEEYEDDSEL